MLFYHNKFEYARVVETVDITEDGTYVHEETPAEYGGAILEVEIVHMIVLADAVGYVEVAHLNNPTPMNQNDEQADHAITIEGKAYRSGSGGTRDWRIIYSSNLDSNVADRAAITIRYMRDDDRLYGLPL